VSVAKKFTIAFFLYEPCTYAVSLIVLCLFKRESIEGLQIIIIIIILFLTQVQISKIKKHTSALRLWQQQLAKS
jgi:hypothetical protein